MVGVLSKSVIFFGEEAFQLLFVWYRHRTFNKISEKTHHGRLPLEDVFKWFMKKTELFWSLMHFLRCSRYKLGCMVPPLQTGLWEGCRFFVIISIISLHIDKHEWIEYSSLRDWLEYCTGYTMYSALKETCCWIPPFLYQQTWNLARIPRTFDRQVRLACYLAL